MKNSVLLSSATGPGYGLGAGVKTVSNWKLMRCSIQSGPCLAHGTAGCAQVLLWLGPCSPVHAGLLSLLQSYPRVGAGLLFFPSEKL